MIVTLFVLLKCYDGLTNRQDRRRPLNNANYLKLPIRIAIGVVIPSYTILKFRSEIYLHWQ